MSAFPPRIGSSQPGPWRADPLAGPATLTDAPSRGEAASIRAMVDRTVADHGLDPRRVFVTGLSAGGAMAAVMLAAYPEAFAGGAVVAGVPYGCAGTEGEPILAAERRAFLANPLL